MARTLKNLISDLEQRGISTKTTGAISLVCREKFFDPHFRKKIFTGEPVPAGYGEESDDVFILAKMIDYLAPSPKSRILEVGTGTGYSTAVLSSLCREIVTVEYNESLAEEAKNRLTSEGVLNVRFFSGDATILGMEPGLFDGVIIYPACVQSPAALFSKLKNGGAGVYPMGFPLSQQITVYRNLPGENDLTKKFSFRDYCSLNSIRGIYGWRDQVDGYIVDDTGL